MLSRDEYLAAWSRWHGGTGTEQRRWCAAGCRSRTRSPAPMAGLPPVAATALGLRRRRRSPSAPAAAGGPWLIAAGVLVGLSGLLDSLDGALAIGTGRASRRGFVLDSVVDRLTEVGLRRRALAGGRAGLAGRRLRRAVLAARLPAGPGRAGRRRRDRRHLGLGAADPGRA